MNVTITPVSSAQRRLCFLDQLEPGNPVYHFPAAVRMRGTINFNALEQSINEIVARHETLRTTFGFHDGEMVQIIHPQLRINIRKEFLENEESFQKALRSEIHLPFNLQTGPLLRCVLYELSPQDTVFLSSMHHIVADGWSVGVLVREFSDLYKAFVKGEPSPLPELEIQYSDFSEWHNELLESPAMQRQIDYWKNTLDGASMVLNLPTDYPRPPIQSFRGDTQFFNIDSTIVDQLTALARKEGVTLYMVLLAAFQLLLSKYTQQDNFVVGTPIANRNRVEIENLIGFFINSQALRADLSGNPNFIELLKRVRRTCLGAYDNQDLPFETLVDAMQPDRDRSRAPIFQVMLVLQNAPQEKLDIFGLTMEIMDIPMDTAKFDLALVLEQREDGMAARWEYLTDLFSFDTIRQIASHYENILANVCREPGLHISHIPMLSEQERIELLTQGQECELTDEWNGGILELFAEQVIKSPEQTALVFEEDRMIYRELDDYSNRVANYLRHQGVGPDTLVGLCIERSMDMVIGILGILKAGGAYVPLDPAYPAERLAFMISDSKIQVLLTDKSFPDRLKQDNQVLKIISFDIDANEIARQDSKAPGISILPETAAYVIYTSGSTGEPKGVLVTHRNVTRLFTSTKEWFHFDGDDVWTLFHSFAFDFSVWELWGALLFGGKLVIVPHMVTRTPRDFYQLLIQEKVTVLNQTPSAFKTLIPVDDELREKLSLRYIVFGGEALELPILRPWFEIHGDSVPTLINMYGITETTVHVTYRPIRIGDTEGKMGSVIGKPIPDLLLYILDDTMEPVPLGVMGELYIGGEGLAQGYLHRPELTEERFLKNPFGQGRLYRTGDMARRLRNGEVEYLGRLDQQVKIRGFRIELGEIETALLRYTSIREAAVITREDTPENKRLVAYVVKQNSNEVIDVDALRTHCAEWLPDYMVPVAFVMLDTLPLNNNGKLDVSALPAPQIEQTEPLEASDVPTTAEEKLLAEVWSKVLNIGDIGVNDNFFELGGDSILTLLVVSEIGKAGFEITPTQIFDFQAIAGLAGVMKKKETATAVLSTERYSLSGLDESSLQRIRDERGEVSDIYPLSPMQEGMLFHTLLEPDSGNYFEQVMGDLEGELNQDAFFRAWQSVMERHPALRTSFLWLDAETPLQMVHPGLTFPFEKYDWREQSLKEQEVCLETFLEMDRQKGFDFQTPPLMRLTLIHLNELRHRWIWSHHHILLDGWSAGLIFKEVLHFYEKYHMGTVSDSLPDSRPYSDYIVWQKNRDMVDAEKYWKNELRGFESVTKIGTTLSRGAEGPGFNLLEEVRLTEEETSRVQEWVRSQKMTLNSLIQGTWSLLLRRYGNEDVVFGVTNSGRPPELEGAGSIVGLFINTLPIRAPLGDDYIVIDWLMKLQSKQAKLMEYEFCRLVDVQRWSQIPQGEALFDSLVIFENYPVDPSINLETAGITSVDVCSFERTNYPLTLVAGPGKELIFKFHYDADRFGLNEIRSMAKQYLFLLKEIIANPHKKIWEISLLSESEREKILYRWNDTRADYDQTRPVQQIFEAQVADNSEAIALEFADERLTYRELNNRANQMANYLKTLGVGSETAVGICMERSPEMVTGILGILKAGGFLVPLAPNNPEERLDFMLLDSGISCLLTLRSILETFPEKIKKYLSRVDINIICLDENRDLYNRQSTENIPASSGPKNLAYMIYTSGSTGKPKGTLLEHRGLVNLVFDHVRRFDLKVGSRMLQFANISFDASILEISIALCSGATLYLEKEETLLAGSALAEILKDKAISHTFLPPTVLAGLPSDGLPRLKVLWSAGEACSRDIVRKWAKGRRFFNAYGPTEATVCSTIYECSESEQDPPIGYPIDNIRTYILDVNDQPLPVGIPGELHVSGVCLARGYHSRPNLTKEKFITNTFEQEGDYSRLYRTGDLCRYRSDGAIEFMGRIDRQVKIRGFRIELGEIESVLKECGGVHDAVVTVREDAPGHRQLSAYVIPNDSYKKIQAEESYLTTLVKNYLANRVPAHMLPSFYTIMEFFPLMPSGKIDRNALPEPERDFVGLETVTPKNQTEEILVSIWEKTLGVKNIGVKDNFFELGGDSILSLQIISRAHQAGLKITPKQIFTSLTIEKLALESEPIEKIESVREELTGDVPITPIQIWFFEQNQPDPHHWNQSLLLEVKKPIDVEILSRSLDIVVEHHQALNFRYEIKDILGRQFIPDDRNSVHVSVFDLSDPDRNNGKEQDERIVEIASGLQSGLDLSQGPLMQAAYFKMGDDVNGRFLLIFHHLIIDGVSWRIILGDLIKVYDQLEKGEEVSLSAVTVSYHQWAAALKRYAQSEAIRSQLDYWTEQEDAVPLKTDFPCEQKDNLVVDVKSITSFLNEQETESLLREAPAAYGTHINDILLTALLIAFKKWTGQKSLRIHLEGHGRNDIGDGLDLSGTVGWFTSIYPVVLRNDQEDSMGGLLKSVKEQLRSIPMNGIGYGLLRYSGNDDDDYHKKLASIPSPEISFNYLGQTSQLQAEGSRFTIANESSGAAASPKGWRYHLLDVNGMVVNDRLKVDFMYNDKIHGRETIEHLSDGFITALRDLINHCIQPESGGYTPSDFDKVELDEEELGSILDELE